MTFKAPPGPTVSATAMQAGPSVNGWRYTSEPLSVDITFAVCSDGMSDRRYHDTVMVLVGEQEYRGCGGDFLPSSNATEDSANPYAQPTTPEVPGRLVDTGYGQTRSEAKMGRTSCRARECKDG